MPCPGFPLIINLLPGNTTFLFELPGDKGLFNGHPDLTTDSILVTYNQSSFRNYADKKLYLRFEIYRYYRDAFWSADTNFRFFYISTPLLKGPYGLNPLFGIDDYNQKFAPEVEERTVVVGWTSLYPDDETAPVGYTQEMVKEMHFVLNTSKVPFPVLEFDAVHASWSGDLLDSLFHVTDFVMFTTFDEGPTLAKRTNATELNRMVQLCGLNRTYLRVHQSIRDLIDPPPPRRTKKPMKFKSLKYKKGNSGGFPTINSFLISLLFIVYSPFFGRIQRMVFI